MNRCPKIGDRVRFEPEPDSHRKGGCTGTVTAIYPNYKWDEDRERELGPLPEKEWQVGVKVDAPLPAWWAYVGTDRFAPEVSRLSRLT